MNNNSQNGNRQKEIKEIDECLVRLYVSLKDIERQIQINEEQKIKTSALDDERLKRRILVNLDKSLQDLQITRDELATQITKLQKQKNKLIDEQLNQEYEKENHSENKFLKERSNVENLYRLKENFLYQKAMLIKDNRIRSIDWNSNNLKNHFEIHGFRFLKKDGETILEEGALKIYKNTSIENVKNAFEKGAVIYWNFGKEAYILYNSNSNLLTVFKKIAHKLEIEIITHFFVTKMRNIEYAKKYPLLFEDGKLNPLIDPNVPKPKKEELPLLVEEPQKEPEKKSDLIKKKQREKDKKKLKKLQENAPSALGELFKKLDPLSKDETKPKQQVEKTAPESEIGQTSKEDDKKKNYTRTKIVKELAKKDFGKSNKDKLLHPTPQDKGYEFRFTIKTAPIAKKNKKTRSKRRDQFCKFLPENTLEVYAVNKNIVMEPTEAIQLFEIPIDLLSPLIDRLGRIIAVMHNNNFVHGCLNDKNILLTGNSEWKIIDFGNSIYYGEKFTEDNIIDLFEGQSKDISSLALESADIKSRFFKNYLINMNFKEQGIFILEWKGDAQMHPFFKTVKSIVDNISKPLPEEVNIYLSELIEKIEDYIDENPSEKEYLKTIFNEFRKNIGQDFGNKVKSRIKGFFGRRKNGEKKESFPRHSGGLTPLNTISEVENAAIDTQAGIERLMRTAIVPRRKDESENTKDARVEAQKRLKQVCESDDILYKKTRDILIPIIPKEYLSRDENDVDGRRDILKLNNPLYSRDEPMKIKEDYGSFIEMYYPKEENKKSFHKGIFDKFVKDTTKKTPPSELSEYRNERLSEFIGTGNTFNRYEFKKKFPVDANAISLRIPQIKLEEYLKNLMKRHIKLIGIEGEKAIEITEGTEAYNYVLKKIQDIEKLNETDSKILIDIASGMSSADMKKKNGWSVRKRGRVSQEFIDKGYIENVRSRRILTQKTRDLFNEIKQEMNENKNQIGNQPELAKIKQDLKITFNKDKNKFYEKINDYEQQYPQWKYDLKKYNILGSIWTYIHSKNWDERKEARKQLLEAKKTHNGLVVANVDSKIRRIKAKNQYDQYSPKIKELEKLAGFVEGKTEPEEEAKGMFSKVRDILGHDGGSVLRIDRNIGGKGRLNKKVKQEQDKLYEELEKKGIGKRVVDHAPKTIIPDEDGKYGAALKFKSTKDMLEYGKKFEIEKQRKERNVRVIEDIGSIDTSETWGVNSSAFLDIIRDEKSREKLSQILKKNNYDVSAQDLEGCYFMLDETKPQTAKLRKQLKNVEKKRGITLFPICIIVPDNIWKNYLGAKMMVPSWSSGAYYILDNNMPLAFFIESKIIPGVVHELVHILFASINTIEDRFNESNRKFIEETTAYCIDGMSFKEIENVLVGKYIEWYIETGRCNETEREKYKNLISNKLIPVADYLDRNYPPQFFDIMIRSSSIEELWAKFGNKIEKGRINKNHSVNREEIQNTINETEQTITDCENIMEEINELE